jgi:carbon-monoxide dehydrogenase medium subunit
VGGNLCTSSPAADTICALIVHNAVCVIAGANGLREVAVEDFNTAPGRTVLQAGELLVSIKIPAPPAGFGAAYLRFIPRNEMDIAEAASGASVVMADGKIASARVALGAVGPRPLFVPQVGAMLMGLPPSESQIENAARLAEAAATPITDMRGTIEHRKQLAYVLTKRALNAAISRAK